MARTGSNIRLRPDGWYEARIELPKGPDGKRQRVAVLARTLKGVQAKKKLALADFEKGIVKTPGPEQTVATWLTKWLEINEGSGSWKPATVRNYTDCINYYVKPHVGGIRLSDLTVEHVEDMLKVLSTEGVKDSDGNRKPASTSTQKRAWSILTAALQVAEDRGLVRRNVAKQAKPPKVTYDERPVLSAAEAKKIKDGLAGPPQDWLYPLYVLSISTGLRQGESLALRWQDVDLKAGTLTVNGTMDRTEHTTQTPKTLKSRRTLKIGPEVVEALEQQQLGQKVDGTEGPDGLVFTSDEGTPIWDSTVRRHWAEICKRLEMHLDAEGKPRIHWHDIRHSAAVLMLQAGVSAETVAWRLGHSSMNMVVRVYGWTSTNTYEDAAEAMTAVLS